MAYFKTEQKNGIWSLRSPEGKAFYSVGINCVNCNLMEPMAPGFDFVAKYGGSGWYEKWGETKLKELKQLGFNSLGAWNASLLWNSSGLPKTVEIRMSRTADHIFPGWGGYGFPDVFAESFRKSAHQAVLDTLYHHGHNLVEDKGLIGYYTDNELHWWGTGGQWGQSDPGKGANDTSLVDDFIRLPPEAPGKQAWVRYLTERYGEIECLNEAWSSEYPAFEDLLPLRELRTVKEVFEADKLGFLRLIAETYFRTTTETLRLYDRNHMILGCRTVGTGTPEAVLEVMGKYVDVFSVNFYTFDLPEEWLERTYKRMGKPVLITEFSFCAGRSAGYPLSTNGAQHTLVPDQKRRGESYRDFVTRASQLPYMVGTHWFALYDFGNVNGLIGNYGIYDSNDEIWEEFSGYVKTTHERLAVSGYGRGAAEAEAD